MNPTDKKKQLKKTRETRTVYQCDSEEPPVKGPHQCQFRRVTQYLNQQQAIVHHRWIESHTGGTAQSTAAAGTHTQATSALLLRWTA